MRILIIYLLIFPFPWAIRRLLLKLIYGYRLHPKCFISRFAIIFPSQLVMNQGSTISAFTVAIHLNKLELGKHASIGRSNWISGFPKRSQKHFTHIVERDPSLVLGDHSAITKKHILDCTNTIEIGCYTTIAGYNSQFLTHSIDYIESRQDCYPIKIGDYCLIGTSCILLPGATLPNNSICGAGSVLNKTFEEQYYLYAGVPAQPKKVLNKEAKYFSRVVGFIN